MISIRSGRYTLAGPWITNAPDIGLLFVHEGGIPVLSNPAHWTASMLPPKSWVAFLTTTWSCLSYIIYDRDISAQLVDQMKMNHVKGGWILSLYWVDYILQPGRPIPPPVDAIGMEEDDRMEGGNGKRRRLRG